MIGTVTAYGRDKWQSDGRGRRSSAFVPERTRPLIHAAGRRCPDQPAAFYQILTTERHPWLSR